MSDVPSWRPPPMTARRPALARCGVLDERRVVRDAVLSWMRRRTTSLRDLAALLGVSLRRAHDYTSGAAPFPLELLSRLPERDVADLEYEIRMARAASRRAA